VQAKCCRCARTKCDENLNGGVKWLKTLGLALVAIRHRVHKIFYVGHIQRPDLHRCERRQLRGDHGVGNEVRNEIAIEALTNRKLPEYGLH
jgi:hypothetical protein